MAESIIKTPKNGTYDYDYIAFNFRGKHSYEDFGIYRVSDNNNGYADIWNATLKDTTSEVEGMDGQYFHGTQHKTKTFSIKIAFDNLTENQLQQAKKWLNGKEVGELWFPEAPHKIYMAKVTGSIKVTMMPVLKSKTSRIYKGTGTIQFTCYHPYAHSPKYIEYNGLLLDGKQPESYVHFYNHDEIKQELPNASYTEDGEVYTYDTARGDINHPIIAYLSRVGYNTVTLYPNSPLASPNEPLVIEVREGENIILGQYEHTFTVNGGSIIDWNTDPYGNGTHYEIDDVLMGIDGLSLYAQWSNSPTISFYKTISPDNPIDLNMLNSLTGPQDKCGGYMLSNGIYISLPKEKYHGTFSEDGIPDGELAGDKSINLPYGAKVAFWVENDNKLCWEDCHIYDNSQEKTSGIQGVYNINVTRNLHIVFEWCCHSSSSFEETSYWNCYIFTSKPNIEGGVLKQ